MSITKTSSLLKFSNTSSPHIRNKICDWTIGSGGRAHASTCDILVTNLSTVNLVSNHSLFHLCWVVPQQQPHQA